MEIRARIPMGQALGAKKAKFNIALSSQSTNDKWVCGAPLFKNQLARLAGAGESRW
jgi:hypothetical protein